MAINTLIELKEFCKSNDRVCPQPQQWNELWNKLKDKKQNGNKWEPPLPLILTAWWDTPILTKQLRLMEHLDWAHSKEQLEEITNFLTSLSEEQWHHTND